MSKYQQLKERARWQAIQWQQMVSMLNISYGELAQAQVGFEKVARRYGLLKEFRREGIL